MYTKVRTAWGVLGAIIAFGLIVSLSQRSEAAKDSSVLAKVALDMGDGGLHLRLPFGHDGDDPASHD
jgi:hypothetical protein